MKSATFPHLSKVAHSDFSSRLHKARSIKVPALLVLVGLLAMSLYSVSSASFRSNLNSPASSRDSANLSHLGNRAVDEIPSSLLSKNLRLSRFMAPPVLAAEGIATFDDDCATPKSAFNLGDEVCAKASGVPVTVFPWSVAWLNTAGLIVQSTIASPDDSTEYRFTISNNSSAVGTWKVSLLRSNGAVRASAAFTVSDATQSVADVFTQKIARDADATPLVGSSVAFLIIVGNAGPDTAQSVQLVDTPPVGATPVSFTQEAGPQCLPAGTGNCTIASLDYGERAEFTAIYLIGGSPGEATTSATATSTTTDFRPDNNTSSVQFEVGAGGGGSPCTLLCPTSLTFDEDPGTGGHLIPGAEFPQPVTTGNCGSVSMTASPNAQGNYFLPLGISTITASTESGETCQFSITVTDDENPSITCPANITTFESSGGSGEAIVNYNVTASDNSGNVTVTCTRPSGDTFTLGTTQVTCTATDDSNNSASCSFDVTVNSVNTTCVLTTQAPIAVDSAANACGANVTYTTPTSDGSGTCGTISCSHASGSFFPIGETLVTCTSNPDGATTSFTVTVNDVTAPVPTLASLPTLTETCSVTAGIPTTIMTPTGPKVVIELPTATDCGGLISGSTNDERTYNVPGTYVVTWNYTDSSGNTFSQPQTVIVSGSDTAAPVRDVATLPTVTDECSATVLTPPTATDNCAGTVTGTTNDPLTYVGAGTYTVHWTYTDFSGNSSSQNQTVVVTDTAAPTISLVGASSITVECHTSFSDPGVTTTDNCVPKNVNVTTTGSVNINVPNTYTITYTATDGGGNQASVQRSVIVEDTTAPTISCPANITVYLPLNSAATSTVVNYTAPVGTDTCGGANTTQTAGLASGASFPVGTTTNTFTVTDGANLSASCSFTVTVLYNFTGFFSPVGNPPVVNNVNAGRAIPLKFSLSGNKGLNIFAAGYPASQQVACSDSAPLADLEGTETSGGSTLTYSPDQYHYNWKTESSWAGTCRQLVVKLNDGTEHIALFKFK